MRIVCQKCSAAYAIDDKFVTPKGVRAQCPRCRHLQLVKKDDAPPAEAPAPAAPQGPSPFLFDMGGAPPAPPPPASSGSGVHFGQTAPAPGAAPNPFDFSAPTSPVGGPFDFGAPPPAAPPFPSKPKAPTAPPPPDPSPFDFSGSGPIGSGDANPFDFGAPPAGAPAAPSPFDFSAPAPAAPAAPSPFDFGAPPPAPAAAPSPFDFGAPGGGLQLDAPPPPPRASQPKPAAPPPPPPPKAVEPEGTSGVKCRTCGKELTDAFDQALGVCDDCRNRAADPDAGALPPVEPPPPPRPSGPKPVFPPIGQPASPPDPSTVRSAMRNDSSGGGGRGKTVGIVVAAAAVLLVAGVLIWKKPWQTKPPPLVVRQGGGGAAATGNDSLVAQWRLKYPDLDGRSASELTDEGEASLAKDTGQGYRDAEMSFEQAMVLSPSEDRALAGWVLAVAFGRPGQVDEPTAKAAEAMLMASEQRSGNLAVFVAHAHLLIARSGNPNDIKVLAERGLNSKDPHVKALAALAIGQTFLTKNPQLAAENFQVALSTDPKLKRAYFFQAQLAAIQGKYKEATKALEKRLELDPDQWEAAEELARLMLDVGETQRARKVLEAAKAANPRSPRPRIGLAVLGYQHLGDFAGASTELSSIIDDPEQPKPVRADAMLHLGTLQRVQGDTDKAVDTIDRALELSPDSVAARLQKFLVLLDKGVTSSARLELDGIKGKLGDKYLEATLEGRLLIGENRLDEATQTLSATIEVEPRRVDALFLSGAAAAKGRKDGKAWELCLRRATRLDFASRPVPSMTQLYVRPADLLKPAVGSYNALVKQLDEDPSPSLCEGLIAWYSEDYVGADKLFAKVISIDPKNATAYAYRAFYSLRKKDVGNATRFAARAVDGGRTDGNAHLAQALALLASKKPDQAKVAAQAASKFNPQSLAAKVILAAVEATRGNGDEARRVLTSVLLSDNTYRDAKRVLYEHQL